MHTPREVEVKFLVADLKDLENKLSTLGFRCITPPTHELNTLYDLPDLGLRRRGQLLRLRRYGDKWLLTHKSRAEIARHKSRIELETAVADGVSTDAILRALGYQPVFIYEKVRSEWSDGKGHIVLDHTPIGDLAEIEGAPRWIDRTAKLLGITPADYIIKSYAELFFDWKRNYKRKASNMTFRECRSATANAAEAHNRVPRKPKAGSGVRPRRA